ncbi:MAG: hypothetical protein LBM96_05885 [Methanobrevibacter sp.]|jgi:hypothetical protein|nr:hypothetical protein [Candidatus Methanoflexus mossambicus]
MTQFDRFKTYINSCKIGSIVYRQNIIKMCAKNMNCFHTIDSYRLMSTIHPESSPYNDIGFLEQFGLGKYKVVKHFPENYTLTNLKEDYSKITRGYSINLLFNILKDKIINLANHNIIFPKYIFEEFKTTLNFFEKEQQCEILKRKKKLYI